jgi:hypothetical protein
MENISNLCPYCHKNVTFSWIRSSEQGGYLDNDLTIYFKNGKGFWLIGICPSCNKGVLINVLNQNVKISPFPLPSLTDERIPLNVKKAIDEAKLCSSVGAPMASSSMSRRAIQCACIEKGATENKKLYEQIDELFEMGIITEQIKTWAHSVRWVGNDGAHPTNLEVSKEDAKDVLDLAEQLMNILYIMPSIAEKHKETHTKE